MKHPIRNALIMVSIILLLSLVPLNYFISKPGHAYDLSPIVTVDDETTDSKGAFHLMTIAVRKASVLSYVGALFSSEKEIIPAESMQLEGESNEDYEFRQKRMMEQSKNSAIYMAYNTLDLSPVREEKGVRILSILPGSAADGILKVQDIITKINDVPVQNAEELVAIIQPLENHSELTLSIVRDEQEQSKKLVLAPFPGEDSNRFGMGITYDTEVELIVDPPVEIDSSSIGGPSAGMMFTLQIIDQLLAEDLTKGYLIAGTGEMLEDGQIGRIGGVDFKVIAAAKEGMAYFLAPDDEITEEMKKRNPSIKSNYEVAKETAEQIKTEMKIIPVRTLQDALDFLYQLPSKD